IDDPVRGCFLDRVLGTDMGLTIDGSPVLCGPVIPGAPLPQSPFSFDLSPANPNPFQNSTTVRFSIAARRHVTITVHNVHGQMVRTLVDEFLDANAYSRDWDGRDDDGKSVANGIYFVRMRANDVSAVKKVLRIR